VSDINARFVSEVTPVSASMSSEAPHATGPFVAGFKTNLTLEAPVFPHV
jgi:hypothetical protein